MKIEKLVKENSYWRYPSKEAVWQVWGIGEHPITKEIQASLVRVDVANPGWATKNYSKVLPVKDLAERYDEVGLENGNYVKK